LGSVVERVVDGVTGFVAKNDQDFVKNAIALLSNEALWKSQHEAALKLQRSWRWPNAAARFEQLIES
jgi:glycosyltransferase involved in cell wall biosynthesis